VRFEIVNPETLGPPRGWNHGLLAPAGGRLLFIAGQIGLAPPASGGAPGAAPGFVEQFGVALDRVVTVIRAAGGEARDLARMTIFVTDLAAYRAALAPLGEVWRARFGKHYPAMALVEVRGLVDRGAMVEIEATAVIPSPPRERS
jgi:enamine deaminase RidA (YjgF/YER057c/UK114 family)